MRHQILIYRKARISTPAEGDIKKIQVGDAVTYSDGHQFSVGTVEKVNVEAGVLRTAARNYNGYILRAGRRMVFSEILKVERMVLDEPLIKDPVIVPMTEEPSE